jgi:hypothetical protein
MLALSIRQPWAWLIVNGIKDVENRTWATKVRGPVLVHAGKTLTKADYEACCMFVSSISHLLTESDFFFPTYEMLQPECGGIVGEVEITKCVAQSESPWFVGEFGFVLANAKPLPFRPCAGRLGFFEVGNDPSSQTPHTGAVKRTED